MTRKDYILIANCIKRNVQKENSNVLTLRELARDICYELQRENPNFSYEKFLFACQLV